MLYRVTLNYAAALIRTYFLLEQLVYSDYRVGSTYNIYLRQHQNFQTKVKRI